MSVTPEQIVATAALVAALIYLGGKVRAGFRRFEAAMKLIDHELQSNSGKSLYDLAKRAADDSTATRSLLDEHLITAAAVDDDVRRRLAALEARMEQP